MRKLLQGSFPFLLIVLCTSSFSQRPQVKFGDIKPQDFAPTAYKVDSSASGVYLFDIGSSKYEGDNLGGFSVIFKRHTRIRLLNRNSFDLATFSISMYSSGQMEEQIESLEATTYTLENGKVQSFKLDKASIFKDRLNKNYAVRKFTLPNLKEGCIIEIKYSFKSPYEHEIRSWNFQGDYPRLWSEYTVTVPAFYDFAILPQGYHPYVINESKHGTEMYSILSPGQTASDRTETTSFTANTTTNIWAMENVPTLKKEDFTTTLDDHIAKVDFQLSKISFPDAPVKNVLSNWFVVAEDLLKDPDFGEGFFKNVGWYKDELKTITAGATTELESAKKIYKYIRDNYTCTSHHGIFLTNQFRKIYQSKSGNVADINLLLTSMLINQGLDAHPAILSTREHGKAYVQYPVMDRFNYVIATVKIQDSTYVLDATESKLGFGLLPHECYNGYARKIDKSPVLIDLGADKISENKLTNIFIMNSEAGGMEGSFTSTLGNYESLSLRERLVKETKEDFFKNIKKAYSFDVKVSDAKVDSLKEYEEPVAVSYSFKFATDNEDVIYVNPTFGEGYKENPFKAAERFYPVEMPYSMNENYNLRMDIPKGYMVDEIPKSTRVKFNEDEGMFEYLVAKDANAIQLRFRIKLNKATFLPDDYQSLRDFFAYIVKKQSEQIVLKKIKS